MTTRGLLTEIDRKRTAKGFSYAKLAEYTGHYESSIWDWMHGITIPKLSSLIDVLDALGLELTVTEKKEKREIWAS